MNKKILGILFSLLMIGCMCVQTPLQVVKGIYSGEDLRFEKREFKIMRHILSLMLSQRQYAPKDKDGAN